MDGGGGGVLVEFLRVVQPQRLPPKPLLPHGKASAVASQIIAHYLSLDGRGSCYKPILNT